MLLIRLLCVWPYTHWLMTLRLLFAIVVLHPPWTWLPAAENVWCAKPIVLLNYLVYF